MMAKRLRQRPHELVAMAATFIGLLSHPWQCL